VKKIYLLLLVLLGLHLFVLTKVQFTAWPEMFSFPYMVNKGLLIYRDFHHAYQPLLTIILSFVYKIFGYKLLVLQIFTWALILISDILIFTISLNLFGRKLTSLIPVAAFVILQPFFEGNMLWFDLATVPLILFSIWFLFRKNWFWAGFFIALGILIKQQVGLLLLGYFVYIWLKKVKFKDFLYFAIGGTLPVVVTFILLFVNGIFNDYLLWTFTFPLKYLPKIPGYPTWPTLKQDLTLAVLASPFLLLVRKKYRTPESLFLVVIFLAAITSSLPRFSYFHLQPMLAIYVILLGMITVPQNRLYLLIVPALVFLYVLKQNLIYFGIPPRFYNKDAESLAKIVRSEIKKNEKVYLLGSNSLIYILSDTVPPKPWIENYVWHFEIPGMQAKLTTGWEKDPPRAIFWSDPTAGNWFDVGTYQPKEITEWIRKNYIKRKEVSPGLWVWKKSN